MGGLPGVLPAEGKAQAAFLNYKCPPSSQTVSQAPFFLVPCSSAKSTDVHPKETVPYSHCPGAPALPRGKVLLRIESLTWFSIKSSHSPRNSILISILHMSELKSRKGSSSQGQGRGRSNCGRVFLTTGPAGISAAPSASFSAIRWECS